MKHTKRTGVGTLDVFTDIIAHLSTPAGHINGAQMGFSDVFIMQIWKSYHDGKDASPAESAIITKWLLELLEYCKRHKKLPITDIVLNAYDRSVTLHLAGGTATVKFIDILDQSEGETSFEPQVTVYQHSLLAFMDDKVIDDQIKLYQVCKAILDEHRDQFQVVEARRTLLWFKLSADEVCTFGSSNVAFDDARRIYTITPITSIEVKPDIGYIDIPRYHVEFFCKDTREFHRGFIYPHVAYLARSVTIRQNNTEQWYITGECDFESDLYGNMARADVSGYVSRNFTGRVSGSFAQHTLKLLPSKRPSRGRITQPRNVIWQYIDNAEGLHHVISVDTAYLTDVVAYRLTAWACTADVSTALYVINYSLDRSTLGIIKVNDHVIISNAPEEDSGSGEVHRYWRPFWSPENLKERLTSLIRAFASKWHNANLFDDLPNNSTDPIVPKTLTDIRNALNDRH